MKYTALTIGPIIKSLGLAQKTRELWVASYFFSALMENVIKHLNKNNAIILPFPDKASLIANLKIDINKIKSAGIFPDRLLLASENGLFSELEEAVKKAISEMKTSFNITCDETDLKNYITAHIIEFEKENENIIFDSNNYLAVCELQNNYTTEDKDCFLAMLENIDKASIYDTVFKKGFKSIFEITTQGLNTNKIDFTSDDDNAIWKKIQEKNKTSFKLHHKYLAIVQADGDSVGEIIKQVAKQGNAKIKEFSKALSSFSLLAANEIAKYKGVPIYTGGDDLLFFAPITNGKENIFELIEKLDSIFKKQVADKFDTEKTPSMSYGISIAYYKFPMHESLQTAQKLLFEKAKTGRKNNLAIKIQKHSGQSFEAVLHKPLNAKFMNLIKNDTGLVLNSILYQFEQNKKIIEQVLSKNSEVHLNAFFDNFYNEDIHNKNRAFIDEIKDFLKETYAKNSEDFNKSLNEMQTQLQIVKFLNATKND